MPAPFFEVIARVMGDDGKWVSVTSRVSGNVTRSVFVLTPRSYVESVGAVEQTILMATREAQRGVIEAYLASVAQSGLS